MSRLLWCGAAKELEMRVLWMFAMVLALVGPAVAQPLSPSLSTGGTNMGPDFYPRPKCEPAGAMPVKPGNDPDALNVYNFKVRSYNQRITAFNLCMRAYVDNAQNDINSIQALVHDAVAAANAR
jgi:hypothetical protein